MPPPQTRTSTSVRSMAITAHYRVWAASSVTFLVQMSRPWQYLLRVMPKIQCTHVCECALLICVQWSWAWRASATRLFNLTTGSGCLLTRLTLPLLLVPLPDYMRALAPKQYSATRCHDSMPLLAHSSGTL